LADTLFSLREFGRVLLACDRGARTVGGVPAGDNCFRTWGVRERVSWVLAQMSFAEAREHFLAVSPDTVGRLMYDFFLACDRRTFGGR
jgi:hypothetical protein